MIQVLFACGHNMDLDDSVSSAPVCPTCGESRISRTTAPPPRFTGWCRGPTAESKPLEPLPLQLAPKEP